MKKVYIFYIFILVSIFFFPQKVSARTLYWDDFNDNNSQDGVPIKWTEEVGPEGYWKVHDGEYEGSVVKYGPDIYSSSLIGDQNMFNYILKVRIKGILGVDKKVMVRYQSPGTRYDISLLSNDGVYLQKWVKYESVALWRAEFNNVNGTWYDLQVEVLENNIKVYVNNLKYLDITDPSSLSYGDAGLQIWPGAYCVSGSGCRTTIRYDDVLICDFERPCEIPTASPTPTITPTPTNTPIPTPTIDPNNEKTVFLPGFGASWNADALLNCKVDDYEGSWTMGAYAFPFYQPLYNALGNQIVPYYYDWRKDIHSHTNYLKKFIDGLGENKVNLVGHSMGGLVSRAYLEQTKDLSNLDRLLTLGSPHYGVVQAYPTWSAGEIKENNFLIKFMETLLLKRCGANPKNNRKVIQNTLPSGQNLLPIFDYLKDHKTNEIKPVTSMNAQNNLGLPNLQSDFWGVKFGTLSGNGFPTLRYLITKIPSNHDLLLGNWVDGKVLKEEKNNNGDGTVLLQSSQIPNAINVVINQNHTGLVNTPEAINKIKNFLDITTNNMFPLPTLINNEPKSALIVMSYPSSFYLVDQNNKRLEDINGIIYIPNPKKMKYQIEIKPKSENTLFIVAQFLNNNQTFWKEYSLTNKSVKKGTIIFDPFQGKEDIVIF